MAASIRTGEYGTYIGNTFNTSNYLTYNQMKVNAKYIYEALKTIRYDKNSGSALSSTQLKNEFTDYALRDIATKLHYQLTGKGETSNAI